MSTDEGNVSFRTRPTRQKQILSRALLPSSDCSAASVLAAGQAGVHCVWSDGNPLVLLWMYLRSIGSNRRLDLEFVLLKFRLRLCRRNWHHRMTDRSWVCCKKSVKLHGDRCSTWRRWFDGEAHKRVQMLGISPDFFSDLESASDLEGWWVRGGNCRGAPLVDGRSRGYFDWYGYGSAEGSFDGMVVPILTAADCSSSVWMQRAEQGSATLTFWAYWVWIQSAMCSPL